MEPIHDIFILHASRDEQPVRGLARRLGEWGFDVYVDLADPALKRPANRELAGRLKDRIGNCRVLLFAFSSTSANSKWTPWALGLAHGAVGRVVLWPLDQGAKWTPRTQEYLSLYDIIDRENSKEFLENLVGSARRSSIVSAPLDAAVNPGGATEGAVPGTGQPDIYAEFVRNGPALYMAWINALMGKR